MFLGFVDAVAERDDLAAPITVLENRWQSTGECKSI